ncbi:MAG: magnesium transporter, partial [Candidatus Enterosoma sp.]|nr:magnesium transporter [Candidatus Enterosoma sp.]
IEKRISLISNLAKKVLVQVLNNVSNDDLGDFLEDLTKGNREKILSLLPKKRQQLIKELARYSDDTVGSIMTTEYLAVASGSTVKSIFEKIKQIGNTLETVRTIFIVDKSNKLLGMEQLESMMFENEDEIIDNIMQKDFPYISPIADKEQAVPICEEYDIPVLAVVSKTGEMLGILTFDDVMDVLEEENTEDVLKQGAVNPTQTPYMETKIFRIARSYVVWLIILLIINTFTGVIVSRFESALLTLPILISFVPALNDSVGNSGSQTTSMVIRALTTEKLEKKSYFKIIMKEALTGLLTGLVIAAFNFGWVMIELNTPLLKVTEEMKNTLLSDLNFTNIQHGYMVIAAIVSTALFIGVFLSKLFAAILPLLAKLVHIDPATMSGPLVASLMDIMTLLIYFTIAMVVINSINPCLLAI